MPPTILKKSRLDRKKSTRKKILETMNEFADSTTIHGFSYAADKKHSPWRPAWVIVLVVALVFTTFQVKTLYQEWQAEPVITTLRTVSQPIEEIEFPAVTICPQGSRQEILDSVLYRQFKRYIRNKQVDHSTLTLEEMTKQLDDFLQDMYPGANESPTQMIKLMVSGNPKLALQNEAVLGIEEKCDPSSNQQIVDSLNKDLRNDSCPDGFEMLGNLYCVHTNGDRMSSNEAYHYCNDQGGAELLYLDSDDDLQALNKYIEKGNASKYI